MADSRCRQLEDLHRQYQGVSLTSDQQALKRKLVSWYNANCRERRASRWRQLAFVRSPGAWATGAFSFVQHDPRFDRRQRSVALLDIAIIGVAVPHRADSHDLTIVGVTVVVAVGIIRIIIVVVVRVEAERKAATAEVVPVVAMSSMTMSAVTRSSTAVKGRTAGREVLAAAAEARHATAERRTTAANSATMKSTAAKAAAEVATTAAKVRATTPTKVPAASAAMATTTAATRCRRRCGNKRDSHGRNTSQHQSTHLELLFLSTRQQEHASEVSFESRTASWSNATTAIERRAKQ
jgi:hypothetical protein